MKKIIVMTTIHPITIATRKFAEMSAWDEIIIIGDMKTPHLEYFDLCKEYPHITYISPVEQENKYEKLSDAIGWNKIQRRSIGFVEAYRRGADIVASVDDDNIPYEDWGKDILVGKTIFVDCYESENGYFDPLSVTNAKDLWHRGYPVQHVNNKNNVNFIGKVERKVMVQADLWDGDPDIDAIERILWKPLNKLNVRDPYCSNQLSPFNSQNTFLHRDVLPFYLMLPYVGRMDDIWASYLVQHFFPNSVIYNKATVCQDRNVQDLFTNLEDEIFGYRNTLDLLKDLENFENYLPFQARIAFNEYRRCFK